MVNMMPIENIEKQENGIILIIQFVKVAIKRIFIWEVHIYYYMKKYNKIINNFFY